VLWTLGLLGGSLCGWVMVSSNELLWRVLTSKAEVERRALWALRYVATTVSVSPQYEYVCHSKTVVVKPFG